MDASTLYVAVTSFHSGGGPPLLPAYHASAARILPRKWLYTNYRDLAISKATCAVSSVATFGPLHVGCRGVPSGDKSVYPVHTLAYPTQRPMSTTGSLCVTTSISSQAVVLC